MKWFVPGVCRELAAKYRRFFIVLAHALLIVAAYFAAYLLRFEFALPPENLAAFFRTLPFLFVIKLGVFYCFGLYSGLWRYFGAEDFWQILKANLLASLLFLSVVWAVCGFVGFPRSVFVIDWGICAGGMAAVRLLSRQLRRMVRGWSPKGSRRVLIVGAGDAGLLVLGELRNSRTLRYDIVGFIDDDPLKIGRTIQGVKVLGGRSRIRAGVERCRVDLVVIAIPSADGTTIREILARCRLPGVKVQVVPRLQKFLTGDLQVKPRDAGPEDLLGRAEVEVDEALIGAYLAQKRVLVTGAGGSIGSELCRQMARFGPGQIILLDHNENDVYFLAMEFKVRHPGVGFKTVIGDIRDAGLLRDVFTRFKPDVVFHAAAHKHVPLMEENPSAAVKNNVIGSCHLIDAARDHGVARFVLISTDKAVCPSSVMGMTKRIAEMVLQAEAAKSRTKFVAVRFGNVLGSAGSIVPLMKKQIEAGGPVTVTHPDVERYFMSISEAAALVLQAGAIGEGGEIFVLDMGEPIKIVDLAHNLIAFSGLEPGKDIELEYTGLRPGEKMTEELCSAAESRRPTRHRKIYAICASEPPRPGLRDRVAGLERLANEGRDEAAIEEMKAMVL